MQNFMKIAESIDVIPLLLAIKRQPELWKEDTFLRDYPQGPFGEINSIMLRFPTKRVFEQEEEYEKYVRGESQFDFHESVDQPAYSRLPEARSIIMALMARVGGVRLGRVIVNTIAPGGKIFPHEDTPIHANYYSRFHVVLQSAPGVMFTAGDETVYMAPCEAWWFDNKKMHEVINNSVTDRIHMVVDIKVAS